MKTLKTLFAILTFLILGLNVYSQSLTKEEVCEKFNNSIEESNGVIFSYKKSTLIMSISFDDYAKLADISKEDLRMLLNIENTLDVICVSAIEGMKRESGSEAIKQLSNSGLNYLQVIIYENTKLYISNKKSLTKIY